MTIVDSNASFSPGNEYLGFFQFAPAHISVTQGEQVEFDNPARNFFPHTAASITAGGTSTDRTLVSGQAFNSSPTRETFIAVGGSWMLDTSTLAPGQYGYFCTVHPWMVGSITVQPAS